MTDGGDLYGIEYRRGEVICSQGEIGRSMYIILSGAVEVVVQRDGEEFLLDMMGQGEFFGEMALIDLRPRSATVKAVSPVRVLPMTREQFLNHLRHDPELVLRLIRVLGQRIGTTGRNLKDMFMARERSARPESIDSTAAAPPAAEPEPGRAESAAGIAAPKGWEDVSFERDELVFFQPKQVIYGQRQTGKSMYLLISGRVELRWDGGGDHFTSLDLHPGDFFGEAALLTGLPHAVTATAKEPTELIEINNTQFLKRAQARPELGLFILQELIRRHRLFLKGLDQAETDPASIDHLFPPPLKAKDRLSVAMMPLSSCGGCTTALLEDGRLLENLLTSAEVVFSPMLMDESALPRVDVALVDGVVHTHEDVENLLLTRERAGVLIAWGTCSSLGGVPSLANQFELEDLIEATYGQTMDHISHHLSGTKGLFSTLELHDRISILRQVCRADDFVRIDYYIPGCPPDAALLQRLIDELAGRPQQDKPKPIVCAQCGRKPRKQALDDLNLFPGPGLDPAVCLASQGVVCLGQATRGGCGGVCPRGGLPCWGCRGPSQAVIKKLIEGDFFSEALRQILEKRTGLGPEPVRQAVKGIRTLASSLFAFDQLRPGNLARLR